MTPIPLLQIIEGRVPRTAAWINGFNAGALVEARADAQGRAPGLATPMLGYAVIHPYFLKPGANELRVDGKPGLPFSYRVATLAYQPGQPLGTVFEDKELLRLQGGAAAGQFTWPQARAWRWTQAAPIADNPAHQHALVAAATGLWQLLDSLAGRPLPANVARDLESSMAEFIQASAGQGSGQPVEQGARSGGTLLDRLLAVASTLKLPEDQSPEDYLRAQAAKPLQPGRDDGHTPHPPVPRDAQGQLPPRLALRPLPDPQGLRMVLFAGGRLARLDDGSGSPLIQFSSRYADGPRGQPGTVRFACDPWFRLNERGEWELDALLPPPAAPRLKPWPQQMLEPAAP